LHASLLWSGGKVSATSLTE